MPDPSAPRILFAINEPTVRGKLLEELTSCELSHEVENLGICVACDGPHWADQMLRALQNLSAPQRTSLRAVIIDARKPPADPALQSVRNAAELHDLLSDRWLLRLLDKGQLTTVFQPMIRGRTDIFAHECLLRGLAVDGSLIPPVRIFSAARSLDLLSRVDRRARIGAIDRIVAMGDTREQHFFLNVSPAALVDPKDSLRSTRDVLQAADLVPSQICFEFIEDRSILERRQLVTVIESYREAGFRISLEGVGDRDCPLALLPLVRPDYMKFDGEFVRRATVSRFEGRMFTEIAHAAQGEGIEVIATGIETAEQLAWVEQAGIQITQGYFWGKPALCPITTCPNVALSAA